MKSKFNVIDIIIFTAVFAICFSAIMLLIRDFSVASYSVDVTVCIEDGASAVFIKGETAEIQITGRHDPAIVHRARAAVDSLTALVIADLYARRCGYMWLRG